jgi:hypothetical protein
MTINEVAQKERNLDMFNNVVALYSTVKHDSPKPVMYNTKESDSLSWSDTVAAFSLDFSLDIEIKAKRLLGEAIYLVFLRAVLNDNLEILPEYTREALGKYWLSYGLGPEGTYRKLYAAISNEQIRSYLKEKHGRTNDPHIAPEPAGVEPAQFN